MKTCSVRGPGRTAAATGSLDPESGTSVASVASSVDWDGFTFPLAAAAISPVKGGLRSAGQRWEEQSGWREGCPRLTLSLVQYWGVPSRGAVATWHIAASGTAHQCNTSQHTISAGVLRVHVTV